MRACEGSRTIGVNEVGRNPSRKTDLLPGFVAVVRTTAFSSESLPPDLIRGWRPVRVKKTRQNDQALELLPMDTP
jgi:hypothetical protein